MNADTIGTADTIDTHVDTHVVIHDQLSRDQAVQRYKRRRDQLANRASHPVLISGVAQGPNDRLSWSLLHAPIYQDPIFLYLTGINQPQAVVWINSNQSDILFLPPYNRKKVFWEGEMLGVGDHQAIKRTQWLTGFRDIRPLSTLMSWVLAYYAKRPDELLGLFWNVSAKNHLLRDAHAHFRSRVKRWMACQHPSVKLCNVSSMLMADHLRMDHTDQTLVRSAYRYTGDALVNTFRQVRHCTSERSVAARLTGELLKATPFGLSFGMIVACGQRATTLHYTHNNGPLLPEKLLLIDCGIKYFSINSDVSRTVPIAGQFNPLQACLYQIVLDAQDVVAAMARPGVTINELNTTCWQFIDQALADRVVAKGGQYTWAYKGKWPHVVSHLIGRGVHDGDPFRDYRLWPLEPGWMISNEPGLYGNFQMTVHGRTYRETLGIRIEDTLLITPTGVENMAANIPKTIADIESLL